MGKITYQALRNYRQEIDPQHFLGVEMQHWQGVQKKIADPGLYCAYRYNDCDQIVGRHEFFFRSTSYIPMKPVGNGYLTLQ